MKKIVPPSNEMLEYIKLNMKVQDGVVVWTSTKFKRKENQMCGWVDDNGYQRIGLPNKKMVRGHQVSYFLYTGNWPNKYIDHINGNRTDNSIENLRLVDDFGNTRNTRVVKNMTGYQGVSFASGSCKTLYKSEIMVEGKRNYLGSFETAESAFEAYKAASLKLHGEHSPFLNGE
jgi:hypothetical protein